MNYHTIITLVDLATKEADALAKKLGSAMQAYQKNTEQLIVLQQYQQDYEQKANNMLTSGTSIAAYQNFNTFLNQLDSTINGQQHIIQHMNNTINIARNEWQVAEQKRMAFNTLLKKYQKQEEQKNNKLEQKANDEHCINKFNRRTYY
jgi:flagellar FliJ protein